MCSGSTSRGCRRRHPTPCVAASRGCPVPGSRKTTPPPYHPFAAVVACRGPFPVRAAGAAGGGYTAALGPVTPTALRCHAAPLTFTPAPPCTGARQPRQRPLVTPLLLRHPQRGLLHLQHHGVPSAAVRARTADSEGQVVRPDDMMPSRGTRSTPRSSYGAGMGAAGIRRDGANARNSGCVSV